MFPERISNLALLVSDDARERRVKIVCAESCTGGLLAGLFTEFAGSSDVLERGFVTADIAIISEQDILGERLSRPGKRKVTAENFIADQIGNDTPCHHPFGIVGAGPCAHGCYLR